MTSRAMGWLWVSAAGGLMLGLGCLELDDREVLPPETAGGSGGSDGSVTGAGGTVVSPSAGGSAVGSGGSTNASGGSANGAGGAGGTGGTAGFGGTAGSGGTLGLGGSMTTGQGGAGGSGTGGTGGSGGSSACGAGRELCESECVDLESDEQNCGSCGEVCADHLICENGECGCPAELPDACSTECVDFASDAENCGGCGQACAVGDTCACGQCLQIRYDFEGDDIEDWQPNQDYVEELTVTNDQFHSGAASAGLTVSLDASVTEDGDWRYFQVLDSDFELGDTLSIRAWVTAPNLAIAPVVQPMVTETGHWGWLQTEGTYDAIPGQWETYCVEVPESVIIEDAGTTADAIGSIGFRVGVWDENTFDGTVYIDTVAW